VLKIASAPLTTITCYAINRRCKRPIIPLDRHEHVGQIDLAVEVLGTNDLVLMHATSTYPSKVEELNLKAIPL